MGMLTPGRYEERTRRKRVSVSKGPTMLVDCRIGLRPTPKCCMMFNENDHIDIFMEQKFDRVGKAYAVKLQIIASKEINLFP